MIEKIIKRFLTEKEVEYLDKFLLNTGENTQDTIKIVAWFNSVKFRDLKGEKCSPEDISQIRTIDEIVKLIHILALSENEDFHIDDSSVGVPAEVEQELRKYKKEKRLEQIMALAGEEIDEEDMWIFEEFIDSTQLLNESANEYKIIKSRLEENEFKCLNQDSIFAIVSFILSKKMHVEEKGKKCYGDWQYISKETLVRMMRDYLKEHHMDLNWDGTVTVRDIATTSKDTGITSSELTEAEGIIENKKDKGQEEEVGGNF